MSIIWAGAVEIALAWAVILGVKIASNAFEWKFEHLLPNYWYPVVKRKLAKPETATLKDKGIPKKISDELEGLLAFMQGGSLQNSRIRMDRTFQDKIEHETKQSSHRSELYPGRTEKKRSGKTISFYKFKIVGEE